MTRSNVDFPQPEGPTKTTNSPSSMSDQFEWITSCAPNFLLTSFNVTDAITLSFEFLALVDPASRCPRKELTPPDASCRRRPGCQSVAFTSRCNRRFEIGEFLVHISLCPISRHGPPGRMSGYAVVVLARRRGRTATDSSKACLAIGRKESLRGYRHPVECFDSWIVSAVDGAHLLVLKRQPCSVKFGREFFLLVNTSKLQDRLFRDPLDFWPSAPTGSADTPTFPNNLPPVPGTYPRRTASCDGIPHCRSQTARASFPRHS